MYLFSNEFYLSKERKSMKEKEICDDGKR